MRERRSDRCANGRTSRGLGEGCEARARKAGGQSALRVEQIGELPLRHMLSYVDDVVTVSENEIRAAVRRLALEARLVAEPGGAVAVAACLFRERELPAGRVRVAVLSGGNVDPALLAEILGETASEPAVSEP